MHWSLKAISFLRRSPIGAHIQVHACQESSFNKGMKLPPVHHRGRFSVGGSGVVVCHSWVVGPGLCVVFEGKSNKH